MFHKLMELFWLKHKVACYWQKLGQKDQAITEMTVILGFARNEYSKHTITTPQYNAIVNEVNEMCDLLSTL